jgi:hypothetical protein
MNPSIDDRIATMITAMQEVVLPALATSGGLATEQAGLVLAHLRVLRAQVDHAVRFELLQLEALETFAAGLAERVAGGEATSDAARRLAAAPTGSPRPRDPVTVRADTEALASALSDLVEASSIDGESQFNLYLRSSLLDYVEHKALQDRAWFAGTGFEFGAAEFPSLPELLRKMDLERVGI